MAVSVHSLVELLSCLAVVVGSWGGLFSHIFPGNTWIALPTGVLNVTAEMNGTLIHLLGITGAPRDFDVTVTSDGKIGGCKKEKNRALSKQKCLLCQSQVEGKLLPSKGHADIGCVEETHFHLIVFFLFFFLTPSESLQAFTPMPAASGP